MHTRLNWVGMLKDCVKKGGSKLNETNPLCLNMTYTKITSHKNKEFIF